VEGSNYGRGGGREQVWETTTMEEGEQVMEAGEMIDLIDGAIHTDGEELSDDQVLDYIEQLLKKREVK
jgi:hypothetical protein